MAPVAVRVGVVCSGNTCRSPVAGAWLRQILASEGLTSVEVWTAGVDVEGKPEVPEEAQQVAPEIGMSEMAIEMLRVHQVSSVDKEDRKTDLIVWITNPEKVGYVDHWRETKETRAEWMVKRAEDLESLLLVMRERDQGFDAKARAASPEETRAAYRQQGINLGKQMKMISRFIRSQIEETKE